MKYSCPGLVPSATELGWSIPLWMNCHMCVCVYDASLCLCLSPHITSQLLSVSLEQENKYQTLKKNPPWLICLAKIHESAPTGKAVQWLKQTKPERQTCSRPKWIWWKRKGNQMSELQKNLFLLFVLLQVWSVSDWNGENLYIGKKSNETLALKVNCHDSVSYMWVCNCWGK